MFTHANGRGDRASHCASSVVFPQPGPAEMSTTGTSALLSTTSIRAARDTVPPDRCGRSSLDSSSPNAGVGRSWSVRRRRGGADFTDWFLAPSVHDRTPVATTPSRGLGRRHDHEGIPTARAPCARGLVLSGLHGELAHGRCPLIGGRDGVGPHIARNQIPFPNARRSRSAIPIGRIGRVASRALRRTATRTLRGPDGREIGKDYGEPCGEQRSPLAPARRSAEGRPDRERPPGGFDVCALASDGQRALPVGHAESSRLGDAGMPRGAENTRRPIRSRDDERGEVSVVTSGDQDLHYHAQIQGVAAGAAA